MTSQLQRAIELARTLNPPDRYESINRHDVAEIAKALLAIARVVEAAERRAHVWRNVTGDTEHVMTPAEADALCDSDDALVVAVDQMRKEMAK